MNTVRLWAAIVVLALAGCGGGDDASGGDSSGRPPLPEPHQAVGEPFLDGLVIGYARVEAGVAGLEQGRALLVTAVYPIVGSEPLVQLCSIVMDRVSLKPLGIISGTMGHSPIVIEHTATFNQLQNFYLWTRGGGFQPIPFKDSDSMGMVTGGAYTGLLELSASFPLNASPTAIEYGGRLPQETYAPGRLPYPDGVGSPPGAFYQFDHGPSLTEELAGAWRGSDIAGDMDFRFDFDGFFSVVDSKGCLLEGTATPATSGHNLFDVRLVDCADHHMHGFAVVMNMTDGSENLFLSATVGAGNPGGFVAFHGTRCETCSNTLSLVRPDGVTAQ
jgi:hypothetical protein